MHKHLIGNRYRIKNLIGEGGMASVYAALDEKLNRQVAIKILHQHLSRNAELRERFLLEARTLSTFDHPNIIKVFDFSGLDSEDLWMVTEILHGVDLAEFIKRYPKLRLHPVIASLIVREVCKALQEVHKLKIVHRDIKPENIMLLDNGHIRLMDFGIAKVNRDNATQTGTFMGSPSYMSPEQIRGTAVDARADIYSLCVLYYEILTGTLPYLGDSTAEVINKIMIGHYTAPHVHLPEIPALVHAIITRGLEKSPDSRFQSMAEVMVEIDRFLATLGFGDSKSELELYMRQRDLFNQRLAAADISRKTLPYAKPRLVEGEVANDATLYLPESLHELTPHTTYASGARPQLAAAPVGAISEPSPLEVAPDPLPQETLRRDPDPRQTTPPVSSQQRFKASSPKIFIRTHRADSGRKSPKKSNSSSVLFGLTAAIFLVLVFGGERMLDRFQRDTRKLSQQNLEPSPKKKSPASQPREDEENEASPPQASEKPLLVETHSVVIDGSSKNPPKVSRKEITTPRSSKPLSSSTKVLPPAPRRDNIAVVKRPLPPEKAPPAAGAPDLVKNSSGDRPGSDNIPNEGSTASERGVLKVASLPASELYIDGKLYGSTGERELSQQGLRLDPGSYVLKFRRKGYKVEEYAVQVRAGESKQLTVTLTKQIELVEFTVRANKLPSRLTIEDARDGGRRRDFTLNRSSMVFNLRPGTYRVAVSNGSDTINRLIELSESEKSMTFNADFK